MDYELLKWQALEGMAALGHKPDDINVCRSSGKIAAAFIEAEKQREELNAALIEWERAMMAAIGEDGVKSVSDAIGKLKAERDELLAALDDIGSYTGEGRLTTPWQSIVKTIGEKARAAIAKADIAAWNEANKSGPVQCGIIETTK